VRKNNLIFLIFLCVIIFNISPAAGKEGITKNAAIGCKNRELILEAHSALRAMTSPEKFDNYMKSGNCWMIEPNIKVEVIGDAVWGKPVEVVKDGKRFWTMQHMIQYSPEKEKENVLAKLYFAAGVWIQCKWAPANTMVIKTMRIGDYGIEVSKIHPDRVFELQKMHLREGKEYAQKMGCDDLTIRMIKKDYEKVFGASE